MTTNLEREFDEAVEATAKDDAPTLEIIRGKASRAQVLMDQIEQMEEAVKEARAELNDLRHTALPDLMASAQLLSFKLNDGTIIKVEDFCSGSLPKDPTKKAAAIALLEVYGAGSMIKTDVEVTFEKHQHARALAVADELRAKGLTVDVVEGVHPQTLQAFARERLRNGEQVDTAALGLYVGRVAKFALPKAKKE